MSHFNNLSFTLHLLGFWNISNYLYSFIIIAMLTFSASPTENVPAKISPPTSVPASTIPPLTSPPAAYPIVLAGRPLLSNENKPKVPPPVPPRGTPKGKKSGINTKGAKHDENNSFKISHDDFISLELDMLTADKYNYAYCDCKFDSLKSSYSFSYIANESRYFTPKPSRTPSLCSGKFFYEMNTCTVQKQFVSDSFSIDTHDYEKHFEIISNDSLYWSDENCIFHYNSTSSLKSDYFDDKFENFFKFHCN